MKKIVLLMSLLMVICVILSACGEVGQPNEPFNYNSVEFGMNIDEVDMRETNEYMELSSTYTTRAYKARDGFVDKYGFSPEMIRYEFLGDKVSKIILNFENVDIKFFDIVKNEMETLYGEPTKADDPTISVKRWHFTDDTVLVNVYFSENRNTLGIQFMDPVKNDFN